MCKGKTVARNLFFSLIISFLANVICFTLFAHTRIVSTVFAAETTEPTEYADCYINLSRYFAPKVYFDVKTGLTQDTTTYTSISDLQNKFKLFITNAKSTASSSVDKSFLFVPLLKSDFRNTSNYIVDNINNSSTGEYIVCKTEKVNIGNNQNKCVVVNDEKYLQNNAAIDNFGLQTYNKCVDRTQDVSDDSGTDTSIDGTTQQPITVPTSLYVKRVNDSGYTLNFECFTDAEASEHTDYQKVQFNNDTATFTASDDVIYDITSENNGYVAKLRPYCYTGKNICKSFLKDIEEYYLIDSYYLNNKTKQNEEYYLYRKNAESAGTTTQVKNCELSDIFQCDYSISYEKDSNNNSRVKEALKKINTTIGTNFKNVILSDTQDAHNLQFINNIKAGLGNLAFFMKRDSNNYCSIKQPECTDNSSETCKAEKTKYQNCLTVLKEEAYFKYVNVDSGDVYYFVKNIKGRHGITCKGYLPKCSEVINAEPLYKDILRTGTEQDGDNNIKARHDYYYNNGLVKTENQVVESNLLFVNSPNFATYNCLDISMKKSSSGTVSTLGESEILDLNDSTLTNKINLSKGYCSDLDEEGKLIYPNGLEQNYINSTDTLAKFTANGVAGKNCYLKSCIDLTPKELSAISSKQGKFCSEYIWLTNRYGFKYFPKEVEESKISFCSDKERNNNLGVDLLKYSQGFEFDNAKCYLKNCFSIQDETERKLVAKANHAEFARKVQLAYKQQEASGEGMNSENIRKRLDSMFFMGRQFCIPGMFFSNNVESYTDIKLLNMNVAFCNDFTQEQLSAMDKENIVPYITPIANPSYNTYGNNVFCRTAIEPITVNGAHNDTAAMTENDMQIPFFRDVLIRYNEKKEYEKENKKYLKTKYIELVQDKNIDYSEDFPFAKNRILPMQTGSSLIYGRIPKSGDEGVGNKFMRSQFDGAAEQKKYQGFYSLYAHCQMIDNLILYRDAAIGTGNFDGPSDWAKQFSDCITADQQENGAGKKCEKDKCGTKCNLTESSSEQDFKNCEACKIKESCKVGIQKCRNKYPDEAIISDIFGEISNRAEKYNKCIKNITVTDTDSKANYCSICFGKSNDEATIKECLKKDTYSADYDNDCAKSKALRDCKTQYSNESVFYSYINVINDKTINCSTYNSVPAVSGNNMAYFECDIYKNNNSSSNTIFSELFSQLRNLTPYSTIDNDTEYNGVVNAIAKACDDAYTMEPLTESNPVPAKGDAAFIRPFIKNGKTIVPTKFVNNTSTNLISVRAGSRARAGCATYNRADSSGLKQPANDSLYFNYINSDDLQKFNFTGPVSSNFNYLTEICLRSTNCSDRTSPTGDVCLGQIPLNGGHTSKSINVDGIRNVPYYNSPNDVVYMFKSSNSDVEAKSKTGTYITRETIGRSTYFIQHVKFDQTATKTKKINYYDPDLEEQISKECCVPAAAAALVAAGIAILAALAGIFTAPFAAIFGSIASATAFGISWGLCYELRRGEFEFPLEGDLYKPYDYLTSGNTDPNIGDVGFLTPITLTDNNNYYYNYYPRSTNLEEDIANKLKYNNSNGVRFYHGTTKSKDIIKACELEDFLAEANNCLAKQNEKDCDFYIRKYDNKTGKAVENARCEANNYLDCLDDKRKKCLESFGVQFLSIKDLDNGLSVFQTYKNGSKSTWFSDGSGTSNGVLPVNIIRLAQYNGTEDALRNIEECKLDKYGDAKAPMSKCRGIRFTHEGGDEEMFFPENEAIKKPFLAGPPLFFNLITTNNMPELFEPLFFLKRFRSWGESSPKNAANFSTKVLDFFHPEMHFLYEYNGTSLSSDLINQFVDNDSTKLYHSVANDKKYSSVFAARFKSDLITCSEPNYSDCRDFRFVIEKKYESNLAGGFTKPIVCAHKVVMVDNSGINSCYKNPNANITPSSYDENSNDSFLPIASCYKADDNDAHKYCLDFDNTQKCPVSVVPDYYCYDRKTPDLRTTLVLKQDSEIDFLHPMINAYITPDNKADFSSIDSTAYAFFAYNSGNDSSTSIKTKRLNQITEYAKSPTQGIALSFTRSECSQAVYEYYTALDLYQRQQNSERPDTTKMLSYKDTITNIETNIIPKCSALNGNVNEFLANAKEIKTYKDTQNTDKVVYKKVITLTEHPEAYGGFNEICVSDKVVEGFDGETPIISRVIAFKNNSPDNFSKTKCMLDGNSLKNKKCLIASEVYVYCNKGTTDCEEKFNITKNTYEYVKKIDCEGLRVKLVNGENKFDSYEAIKACYKGGFNMSGSVRAKDGTVETSCDCQLKDNITSEEKSNFNDKNAWEEREITPRELGLCVNLEEPIICPAVKYFDSNNEYVDDSLALGKTMNDYNISSNDIIDLANGIIKDEEGKSKGAIPAEIVQHFWRTRERQHGILPAVFFSTNLGHAEFNKSVYCETNGSGDTTSCLGGTNIVEGECKGYWQNSTQKAPTAICKKYTTKDNETVYEYAIKSGGCKRYECNDIGYSDNTAVVDEILIPDGSANLFTDTEITEYEQNVGIDLKEFNILHNIEESDINKKDRRGQSNGFAVWRARTFKDIEKDREIADFAQEVVASECLTGYAPVGVNYYMKETLESNNSLREGNSFIDYNNVGAKVTPINSDTNNFINLQKAIKNVINNTLNRGELPKRICNQKGEWMTVQDIYNNSSYFKDPKYSLDALYYFDNPLSIDIATKYKEEDSNGVSAIDKYIDSKYKDYGYCERLICLDITKDDINNKNIYDSEYLNTRESKDEEKNYFWKHTGGATWKNISATRNSSSVISATAAGDKVSRNILKIAETVDENSVNVSKNTHRYKYLKKVQGQCVNEYGYFNRGTSFSESFSDQISSLVNAATVTNADDLVRPQDYGITKQTSAEVKPERYCNSYGVWSGVKDNCFRACEMLDIFRVNLNSEFINGNSKPFNNNDIMVQNSDILNVKISGTLADEYMEHKFKEVYNLDSSALRNTSGSGYTYGDYLTGGARWPRTIVSKDATLRDSNYHNLRYVEVEADCETLYATRDNRIRQYVKNAEGVRPKRRCYEDGTWGPVYGDTRCILAKTCSEAKISLANLKTLMEIYEQSKNLQDTKEKVKALNSVLSSTITFDDNKTARARKCANNEVELIGINNCLISTLAPNDATAGKTTSENSMGFFDSLFTVKDEGYNKYVCNQTGEDETTYTDNFLYTGWNFKTPEIGDYFIPQTCNMSSVNDFVFEQKTLNRGIQHLNDNDKVIDKATNGFENKVGTKISYAKNSNLEFIADNADITKLYSVGNTSALNDRRDRSITIGNRGYNSYQVATICDPDVFYNFISSANSDTSPAGDDTLYFKKYIVLECNERTDANNGSRYAFNYAYGTENNQVETAYRAVATTYENCLPKTCGGSNSYQKNWTQSVIDLFAKGAGNGTKYERVGTDTNVSGDIITSLSSLECGDGRAFVIDKSSITNISELEKYIKYYEKGGVITKEEAKDNGIVKGFINVECTTNDDTKGEVNGVETKGKGTYGFARHGKLKQLELISKEITFCDSMTRKNCKKLSESYIANNDDFKKTYCVPIGCPMTNLYAETNASDGIKIYEADKGYTGSTFSLAGATKDSLAQIGDVYVIQSVDGDYNDSFKSNSSISVKNYSTIAGNAICGSNADIYNTGVAAFDFYADYFNNLNDQNGLNNSPSDRDKASTCFGKLTSNEAVSLKSVSGYTENTNASGGDKVYVEYSEAYKEELGYTNNLARAKNSFCTGDTCTNGTLETNYGGSAKKLIKENILDIYFNQNSAMSVSSTISNVASGDLLKSLASAKEAGETVIHNKLVKDFNTALSSTSDSDKNTFFIIYSEGENDGSDVIGSLTELSSSDLDTISDAGVKLYKSYGGSSTKFFKSTYDNNDIYLVKFKENIEKIISHNETEYICKAGTKINDDSGKCKCKVDNNSVDGETTTTTITECATKTEEVVDKVFHGTAYLRLDVYLQKFNEQYSTDKQTLINAEVAKISLQSANYKEIYEYYMTMTRMKAFLNTGNNNQYYSDYWSNVKDINTEFNIKNDILSYSYYTTKIPATGGEAEIDKIYEIEYNIINKQYVCFEVQTQDIASESDDQTEDGEQAEETMRTSITCNDNNQSQFKQNALDIFKKFISKTELVEDTNSGCNQYYNGYLNAKKNFNNNNQDKKSDFRPGFFMGMECTLNSGWKPLGKAVCKNRCSGNAPGQRLDPKHIGDWDVWAYVENLRYGSGFNVRIPAYAQSGWGFSNSRIDMSYTVACVEYPILGIRLASTAYIQNDSPLIRKNKTKMYLKGVFNGVYTGEKEVGRGHAAALAPASDGSYGAAVGQGSSTDSTSDIGPNNMTRVILHVDWRD